MIAAAKSYELVTLELHEHYNELDIVLQREFKELLKSIRNDLINGRDILESIDDLIEPIFSIRIKAMKWLIKKKSLSINDTIKEAEKLNFDLSNEERFELLSENIGFALRTIKRVTKAIITQIPSSEKLRQEVKQIPDMDYWGYFDLLSMTIPNEELVEKLMELTDSSIELDYALLSALLIQDENLNVSQDTINDLAELIAFAAQNYSAYSVELGIMPMRALKPQQVQYIIPDEEFINQQQLLADSGLEDLQGN